ncbi:HD domain-containing protein [Staphylococcus xylosus]|nr:HD domain-containing protein [Staphylococcus xylosus]MCE7783052.1 HD domain-containing protein [Staphylococcus xylosus]MEB6299626.1 HD domain-containing protein [Staphylococcus xylosus]WRY41404.1 HD domain-containing protein [Staphylococcus xylosus]
MTHFHKNDATGHDIAHVNRVVKMATYISKQEQAGDLLTIQLASLLHDTVDTKLTNTQKALQNLKNFLTNLQLAPEQLQHILYIIENISYKNGQNNLVSLSIEGQIVRDADRLDAIGAIGIARTFQFSGHFKESMWKEHATKNINEVDASLYSEWSPSAIKHFYEKLFKLKDLMHTTTAKQIAQERHQYMQQFVEQFFNEWYY